MFVDTSVISLVPAHSDVSPSLFAHSTVPDDEALGKCFLLTGSQIQMAKKPPNKRGTMSSRSMFDKDWHYTGIVIFIAAAAISSNSGAKWCYDIQSVNASMVKCIMRVKLFDAPQYFRIFLARTPPEVCWPIHSSAITTM